MKYLRSFYKRHRGMAALALLLLLGQVVGTLLIPALIANVVDLGILPGDMDAILRTGGQMLAVALLSAAGAAPGRWVTADLGARFGFEMRSLLLRKSQELSLHQFDEVGVSSMITRTTSDITNLQQTMGMVLQMVVPAPLIVGASIVMTAMVTRSWPSYRWALWRRWRRWPPWCSESPTPSPAASRCAWTASTVWCGRRSPAYG